jgi:PAS domain S-box-containing protein
MTESNEILKQRIAELEEQVASLEAINCVLMERVETAINNSGNAFSLFERNILLEQHINQRTRDLIDTNLHLKREIAERTRAEKDNLQLKFAIEQAAEGIVITDIDSVIEYVNPAFLSFTGYSREEVIGQRTSILKSGRQSQEFYRNLWDTCLSGKVWKGKLFNKRKDGSVFEEELIISPIWDKEGKLVNFVAITRDISKESMLEAQLRQAQKLESIGTLAGGVAHDFNNILTPILGYSDMILMQLEGNNPVKSDIEQIAKAAYRAKDLVKQILAFSRQSEQSRKPVRLHLIFKEALKLLRASLPATIEIQESLTKENDTVESDASQMHQVLMNLCTNAFHAMRDKGGILRVTLDSVTLDNEMVTNQTTLCAGQYIRLTVSDTGQGMEKKVTERMFEPFFTTKGTGEGTGLGLSTVHGIVASHNGGITVSSALGKGTTFNIYLPTIPDAEDTTASTEVNFFGGYANILFVDDEKEIARMAKSMLEPFGFFVTAFSNSIEALESFTADPDAFDLVITDQTMPLMTGDQLVEKMLAIKPNLPVIMITGYSEKINSHNFRQFGIRELLMKPLLSKDVLAAIQRVFDELETEFDQNLPNP